MAVDVATPLPQLDLDQGTIITVTLDDPAAVITSLTLHGWQAIATPGPETITVEPLWIPLPTDG